MVQLVKPAAAYKDSYIQAAKEFSPESAAIDFEALLTDLEDQANGVGLKEGYVPASTFWLVDGKEFIGRVSIRHKLTDALSEVGGHLGYEIRPSKRKMGYGSKIVELALPLARSLGINNILITCDDDNVGSWKIIEQNGGVLENTIERDGKKVRRYWIKGVDTVKLVGFDFDWDETKVWQLDEPVTTMPIDQLTWHFDVPFHWHGGEKYNLTSRQIIEHPAEYPQEYARTMRADLRHPIDIMENKGRWLILDGLHRLMKSYIQGRTKVEVRIIPREKIPEIQIME